MRGEEKRKFFFCSFFLQSLFFLSKTHPLCVSVGPLPLSSSFPFPLFAFSETNQPTNRRIKTEFLVQMQGVGTGSDAADKRVLVLGATNLPYALDNAIRRRFDKRIYIPLPDLPARSHMFKVHLGDTPSTLAGPKDYDALAARTEGFSGSDIAVVVKDVLMEPVRKTQDATHFRSFRPREASGTGGAEGGEMLEACSPGEPGAFAATLAELADRGLAGRVATPSITMRDFEKALLKARPTVSAKDIEVQEKFTSEFGEEGS